MKKFFQKLWGYDIAVESNNVNGWVIFRSSCSLSKKDIDELKNNLIQIVEKAQSSKEVKRLVKQEVRRIGGSAKRFLFAIQSREIYWDSSSRLVKLGALSIQASFCFAPSVFCNQIKWAAENRNPFFLENTNPRLDIIITPTR